MYRAWKPVRMWKMPRRPDDGAVTDLGRLVESAEKLTGTADCAIKKFDGNTELFRAIVNDLITGDLKIVFEVVRLFPLPKFAIYLDQRNKKNDPRVHKHAA